ncbi:hypothetical protein [Dyella ginsengisoli]|uniref:hypothetical protein n=1 Tax=Dyella ginsengisoli TaxID=363848 RepID=UPI00034C847B|nr:hypothetical protein [Dyella ginsengisoli]
MRARDLLLTFGRTTYPSVRWLVGGVFPLGVAVAIVVRLLWPGAKGGHIALLAFEGGVAYLWAFFMPASLLLARDARQLRIPRLEAVAAAAVGLAALATVGIGAALGKATLGETSAAALTALVLASGFAFSLLPGPVAMLIGLLPAASDAARRVLPVPTLDDPRSTIWWAVAAAGFGVICAIRWHGLIRLDDREAERSSAMVMRLRGKNATGHWAGSGAGVRTVDRRRPGWLQPEANLRRTGPAHPVASLRVALGGGFVPQTLRGLCRRGLTMAGPMLVFIAAMMLILATKPDATVSSLGVIYALGTPMLAGLAFMLALGLPLVSALTVRQRWSTSQRELAVLGVLPGLGTPDRVRQALLRAALARPVVINLLLTVAGWIIAQRMNLSVIATLALVGAPLLCLLAGVALTLDALGPQPLRGWALGLVCSALTIVVLISTITGMLASQLRQGGPWAGSPALWSIYLAVALALTTVLGWIAARGARGMARQPHPFLAHG